MSCASQPDILGAVQRNNARGRLTSSALSSRLPIYATSVLAFLSVPHLALAADQTFNDVSQFQQALTTLLGSSGNHTLTYTGPVANPKSQVKTNGSVNVIGNGGTVKVDFGQSHLFVESGVMTVGAGGTLTLGEAGAGLQLRLGATGQTGELHINGGTVNLEANGDTNPVLIGYNADQTGVLRITNGGVFNLGMGDATNIYSGFFVGYQGGDASLIMDGGRLNVGEYGASMRFGMRANATVELTNGSVIDSSRNSSHFWLGQYAGGHGTMLIDNSSLLIHGDGATERYFQVGADGGTGIITQRGDDSVVQLRRMTLAGIGTGWGDNTRGTYNLEGGLLEVGSADYADNFAIGYKADNSNGEGYLNISGGTARIWGNLQIASNGRTVEGTSYRPTGAVTLTGGALDIGKKITFGTGYGSVNVMGGTLMMAGSNAITGTGTLGFDGGTLLAKGDLEIRHAAQLGDNGAVFNSGLDALATNTLTFAGVLSGTGGLGIVGTGTTVLSGANTYVGATVVEGSTVRLAHATGFGAAGNLVTLNDSALQVAIAELSYDLAVSGQSSVAFDDNGAITSDISGTGSLALEMNDNTVELSGQMSQLGAFTAANGTLITTADDALSSAGDFNLLASARYVNGEDLTQSVGGLNGFGTVENHGVLSVGRASGESSFDGVLTGAGRLESVGGSTLYLTRSGNIAELRAVEGILSVNGNFARSAVTVSADGRLQGNGVIGNLSATAGSRGGVVAAGNSIGTLTVANADLDGLTLEVEVGPDGTSDLLRAVGADSMPGVIDFGGSTIAVSKVEGTLTDGAVYTIAEADEIIYDADDVIVESRLAFFTAEITATDVAVTLELARNDLTFGSLGNTRNQQAVGTMLDGLGEEDPLMQSLLASGGDDVAQLGQIYDAMSGEIHASAKTALAEETRHVRVAFNDRLRASGAGAWAIGYGIDASTDGDGNAADFDRTSSGLLVGFDATTDAWKFGALIGTGTSELDIKNRGSSASGDNLHLGVYGGTAVDNVAVRFGLGYTRTSLETSRLDATQTLLAGTETGDAPAETATLDAKYDTSALHLYGELGYRIERAGGIIEPFANLAHVRLKTDGYAETGSELALRATSTSDEISFATLGVHASQEIGIGGSTIAARGTLAWQRAMGGLTSSATHSLAFGDSFTVYGANFAESTAILEAGVDVTLAPNALLSVSYGGAFAEGSSEHRGQIGLNIRF